ncbi:cysteine hydrolase family protein [Aneurinibacillus sp. REN35]|uniref:cysteine hydrolase family protein n=1 Tax=Aneurinibacillus sp. REN35 TaxID=3237286 RepID=UPI00352819F4
MEKTALLLVDIQNDYFPNGRMELYETHRTAENARRVLDFFRDHQLPLFHIRHLSVQPGATFFIPGTEGASIHETVAPLPNETIIEKNYPNSFLHTSLLTRLQELGIENLIICGMMSHMCIDATTRAASDYGFRCTVIEDACTSPALSRQGRTIPATDVHHAFMTALSGFYAVIETADDFLAKQPTI